MNIKNIAFVFAVWCLPIVAQPSLNTEQIEQIEDQAAVWAEQHKDLDPFSIQLIGNLLYYSYKQATYDEQVRIQFATLTKLMQKTKDNVADYSNPKGITTLLAYMIGRFHISCNARHHAHRSWKQCVKYIEQQDNKDTNSALQTLQQHGQQLMIAYISNNKNNIDVAIRTAQSKLQREQKSILLATNTLNKSFKRKPYTLQNNSEQLMLVDFALQMHNQAYNSAWNIIDITNGIQAYQRAFITVCKDLFYAYYKAFYPLIMQQEEQCHMVLFCHHGLLAKEEQIVRLNEPAQLILLTKHPVT